MIDLQKEAEEHAKKVWGIYIDDIDEDCNSTRGENTIKDYIAGATTSKHVQAEKLKAQIEVLEKAWSCKPPVDELIYTLKQQLSKLENEKD